MRSAYQKVLEKHRHYDEKNDPEKVSDKWVCNDRRCAEEDLVCL